MVLRDSADGATLFQLSGQMADNEPKGCLSGSPKVFLQYAFQPTVGRQETGVA